MANPEHLAVLKKGVQVWNAWRQANPEIKHPDLSCVDLASDEYKKTPLFEQNDNGQIVICLKEANLLGVNLRETRLFSANLQGADLEKANLQGSCLAGADLQGAYLIAANLRDGPPRG